MTQLKCSPSYEPVAIIGYGCTYAGMATNKDSFWELIISGGVGVREMTEERVKWKNYYSTNKLEEDKTYSIHQGLCEYPGALDEKYQGKLDVQGLNRIQIMSLNTIISAFDETSYDVMKLKGKKIACYVGNMLGDDCYNEYSLNYHRKEIKTYLESCENFRRLDERVQKKIIKTLMKNQHKQLLVIKEGNAQKYINSLIASGIKKTLQTAGPAAMIDGACASSVLALDEAIKLLHETDIEMCIVTGTLGCVNVTGSIGLAKIGALSEHISRPLDLRANGLNASEGFGTVLLKPLQKAIQDKDHICGVITGTGVSNDGHGKSIYAPSRRGQVKSMQRALKHANLLASQLDYIELHATGTQIGDTEEFEALKLLFAGGNMEKQSVALGSIKSQIGHSFSAAGMAGVIKVLEAFSHEELPPTWGVEKVKESWEIEKTPFYVNTKRKTWKRNNSRYRAMVNAFGFGGCNGSVILEEYAPSENDYKGDNAKRDRKRNLTCDIAITGIGVMAPTISNKYPVERWNLQYSEIYEKEFEEAGFIESFSFPFLKYKIPPLSLAQMDRAQQIALITAGKAIEDCGMKNFKDQCVSVYVGKNMNTEQESNFNTGVRHVEFLEELKKIFEFEQIGKEEQDKITQFIKDNLRSYVPEMTEDSLPGYMDNVVAARISNHYDFDGSNVVIDGWTNAFSIALKQAIMGIKQGDADIAVVGGIHANMTPETLNIWKSVAQGREKRIPAEGCIFYVLKRYEDVTKEDKIYAKIRGIFDEVPDDLGEEYSNARKAETSIEYEYFGADMAFRLLKGIQELESDKQEEKFLYIKEPAWFYDAHNIYLSKGNLGGRRYE